MGLHLAFITGALWTKRGERGVSRKIPRSPPLAHKVPVMRARLRHDSSIVWQFFNDRGEFPWEHVASPLYFPLSPSLTNACITRGSVFKPDSLSLYEPFDTLVAEINTIIFRTVITVPSCAWYGTYSTAIALEVENIHCYVIYHSHSPTKSEHISKFASRGYQPCYTSS